MGNVRMRAEQINYGASNVKVALDDLDPKDLIALSARMDTIEAWKATVKAEEKTGAEVTFTNALALDAVSLSAEIEAVQDLHGYDHPWVGGAGKNKLPQTVASIKAANTDGTWTGNVYAINNGTVEILTDNASNIIGYKVNGTFNAATTFKVGVPTGGNILNGCPSGGSWESYLMYQNNGAVDTGSGGSGVITTANVVISVASGYNASNLIFRPMTRANDASADFVPYSNICPISGRTSVTITDYDSESNTATVTIQLGQTVYGGTLNVTTGVLTVKTAVADMGNNSFSWDYHNSLGLFYGNLPSNAAEVKVGGQNGLSSAFKCVNSSQPQNGEFTMLNYTFGVNKTIWVHDERYTDPTAFKTAVTGQTVTYPLATPTTIQLSPTDLQMLKGYNRLSSDGGGDITVKAYTGAPWGGDEA